MNSKTAKLIQHCAVIMGKPEGSLKAEWNAATPRQRGKLRRRWIDYVHQLKARLRKKKAAQGVAQAERDAARAEGKAYVTDIGAVPPPPGMTPEEWQREVATNRQLHQG